MTLKPRELSSLIGCSKRLIVVCPVKDSFREREVVLCRVPEANVLKPGGQKPGGQTERNLYSFGPNHRRIRPVTGIYPDFHDFLSDTLPGCPSFPPLFQLEL